MLLLAKKFARDIPALIGLVIVIGAITIAIVGPWIAPHPGDVVASHLTQRLKPPSAAFPFGTTISDAICCRGSFSVRGVRSKWP
jgi:peptide/nickel transport system permease protein